MTTDAQLFGVYVPRPGTCEGVQHEPHYAEALAGKPQSPERATEHSFDLRLFHSATERINLLSRFQLAIQENYRNNPFHNFRHCFCVSQMMYGMIHLCNLQVTHTFQVTGCVCACHGCHSTESYAMRQCASNGRISSRSAHFVPNLSLKCQLSTFLSFMSFQGEADSHRHGDSDDSRRVSRPGPPWL